MESKLGVEEGAWLTKEFSGVMKSPGPDGFSTKFFKERWEVIKGDLCRVLAEFHSNGRLTRGCKDFCSSDEGSNG